MGERTDRALKRRGLLAGAAALAGVGLAKLAGPGTAQAGHEVPEDVFHLQQLNTTAASTILMADLNSPGSNNATLTVINHDRIINSFARNAIVGFVGSC